MRPLIVLLQIAVAVLLLIACANVAHLLLGQAATRQAEISMRYALGADRSRIVRQLLIETLIIAVPGGIAGLALAIGGRARAGAGGAAEPAAARGDLDRRDRAGVHAGDDAADRDRVRPRPGDADGAHLGERSRPHRPARRRPPRRPPRPPGARDRRARAGAGAAGRRGAAARQLRARDADRSRLRASAIACSRRST